MLKRMEKLFYLTLFALNKTFHAMYLVELQPAAGNQSIQFVKK
jgi:hypothetical protein